MSRIPPFERKLLFEQAMQEAFDLWRNKDYDKAYKAVSKANLSIPDFDDQFEYLFALSKIKGMQSTIIACEKKPDYSIYLNCCLESFALDIARDLVSFPHLSGFYYRKKTPQYSPYDDNGNDNTEILPDEDSELTISLKKLNLFKNRKIFFEEYLNFIYNDLPAIYGIPDKYTKEYIDSVFANMAKNHNAWIEMNMVSENLKRRELSTLSFEIYNFVNKLIVKYYEFGNTGIMPRDHEVKLSKSGIYWDPNLISRKRLQILMQLNPIYHGVAGSIYDDTINNFMQLDEALISEGKEVNLTEALNILENKLLKYIKD